MDQVGEFHLAFGHPIAPAPTLEARTALRVELIREEFRELQEALGANDVVAVADALGDLAYVIAGAALEFGIPLDRVVEEIHRSNMSKLGADGKPITREDGKTLKGPNYRPPSIAPILERRRAVCPICREPKEMGNAGACYPCQAEAAGRA